MTDDERATRAVQHLKSLQDLTQALTASGDEADNDAGWDVLHEAQRWCMDIQQHIDGRQAGFVLVLDRGVKDEDAGDLARLLLRIDGVLAIEPIPEDISMHVATRRVKDAVHNHLYEALSGFRWPTKEEDVSAG